MTPDEARKRLEHIRAIGDDDPESAHAEEDALHVAVLRAIASSSSEQKSRDLAKIALSTLEIEFPRWYA